MTQKGSDVLCPRGLRRYKKRMASRLLLAAAPGRAFERQRLQEVRDAPGAADHRIGCQARAGHRGGIFRQPFQVSCLEQCDGSGSMGLQVTFQLETQHSQGRMAG